MNRSGFFILCLLIVLPGACMRALPPGVEPPALPPPASPAPAVETKPLEKPILKEVKPIPAEKITPIPKIGEPAGKDEEIFIRTLQQLAEPATEEEYRKALHGMETLINDHPESKWQAAARAALRLVKERDAGRDKLRSEQKAIKQLSAEKDKMIQANEQLKKDSRLLSEKYQSEITSLQQENGQLKKDLELLKNLELQLDKREKMLR